MWSITEFKKKMEQSASVQWRLEEPLEFFWGFEMKADRDQIWAYLSDTSRLNRELGLSPRNQVEKGGSILVTTSLLGFPQEWIEEPWAWLAGQTIGSTRTYVRGIAKKVQAVFHIEREGDLHLVYIYFSWHPSNIAWKLFLRATAPHLKDRFRKTFAKIDQHILSEKRSENALSAPAPLMTTEKMARLSVLENKLLAKNLDEALVRRLCRYICTADDLELESIRLVPLAKNWGVNLRDLVVTALHATRVGLLNISWKVICPHCRGSRFSALTLGEIPDAMECSACDIKFSTSDADSIEIVFHSHPSIREVKELLYCAAEPAKKLHIKVQRSLEPGEIFSAHVQLKDGLYRARFAAQAWNFEVDKESSVSEMDFSQASSGAKVNGNLALHFRNQSQETALFVVEEMWWKNGALKPAQLLSLWEFRDLFSEEHLDSNVKLFLGEQTILFTDIVGSTRFYQSAGDAKAFSEVRAQFQEVFEEVKRQEGIVVKTIGDAVMASFPQAEDAVRAAVNIQKRFPSSRSDTEIRLRVSIHTGLVIAVQLNTGIDYFGNTVNIAAKIQTCAQGGEIALSEKVYFSCRERQSPALAFPCEKRKNLRDSSVAMDVYVLRVDPKI